jgi:hypothetical protein
MRAEDQHLEACDHAAEQASDLEYVESGHLGVGAGHAGLASCKQQMLRHCSR